MTEYRLYKFNGNLVSYENSKRNIDGWYSDFSKSETFEKIKTGFKAVDFAPTGVMIDQLKELPQKDRAKVLRHFCRGCNRYLEEGEFCYCEKY